MKRTILTALVLAALLVLTQGNGVARAASAAGIDADVDAALMKLYEEQPVAKMLTEKAAAILVFPNMVKAGFIVGAQYGEGALRKKGKTVGYYNSVAASYGLQAGAQTFGYVLFLMTDSAVNYLNRSGRLGDRSRPKHRCGGRRHRPRADEHDTQVRCLRLHLRPEGSNGRHRAPGLEDYQDKEVSGW